MTVDRHRPSPPNRPRVPYLIYASDETGDLVITYFHARADYLQKLFPVGEKRYVSGTTALYDGMLQMVHPDRVVDEKGLAALPMVEPVYPLTEGLELNQVRRATDARGWGKFRSFPNGRTRPGCRATVILSFGDALLALHRPQEPTDIAPQGPAWTRLAYDELLASQIALTLVRAHIRRQAGRGSAGDGRMRARRSSPPCPIR